MRLMEGVILLFFLVLLIHSNLLQGLEAKLSQGEKNMVKRRLETINKPFIKSYQTKYGDILDCVDINKQFAFDHSLLKNHTIQMKPNFEVLKQTTSSSDSSLIVLSSSKLVPKNMRCPSGTVPIRRIQEEDLAMEKFSSKLATAFSTTGSSKSFDPNNDLAPGHQIATVVAATSNVGASGVINVWSPEVAADQLSDASVFIASDGGGVTNAITAGWAVNPFYMKNNSRLFGYWTSDSGKRTGCFNVLCPGFIQISREIVLGSLLGPVSTYGSPQHFIAITIKQDQYTKNWWLMYGTEGVGYWPKELFSTLANGATRAGWGGEIYSPPTEASPAMGSGHFPEEGYSKACIISRLDLVGAKSDFPSAKDIKVYMSKPNCYKATYEDTVGDFRRYMYFGGPPNCKV